MADFEGLINQALAKQDITDPAVRARVFQSSRNALVKMLEKSGNLSDEAVRAHFDELEGSISRIEARFRPEPPTQLDASPVFVPVQKSEPAPERAPEYSRPPQVDIPSRASPTFEAPKIPQSVLPTSHPKPNRTPVLPTVQPALSSSATPVRNENPVAPPEVPLSSVQARTAGSAPVENQAPSSAPAAPKYEPDQGFQSEPDIIDLLESLIPATYQPRPMFPPVTLPGSSPAPASPSPASHSKAMPSSAGYQQPAHQPEQAEQSARYTPQVPRFDTRDEPRPDTQTKFPSEVSRDARRVDPSDRPEQSIVEDDYRVPEKVAPYLGDVTEESIPSEAFEEFDVQREPARAYQRKNPLMRRIWPIFLAIAVVLVVLWILYALLANMPREQASDNSAVVLGPVGESQTAEDGSVFITLLEPTDLSALVTAGRGTAELITEQNQQFLRLQSVRQGALTATGAEPILLELEKGVLNQISGKIVTVELYAKSGQNGPAQFAVECDFAGDSICGRKRFPVGTQPARIVFTLDLTTGIKAGERAYLAINTDITNAADSSGSGDAIDVIYARLRMPDGS